MSIETESNIINFREVQRRAIDQRHETRRHLVKWAIDQANCDIKHLFGASAAEVASVSLAIADLTCPIGDHRGWEYAIASEEGADALADEESVDEENLAGFIAAVAGDALKLEHSDDPTFNANEACGQCEIQARRVVATYF
jgi:hypothetical protein